MAARWDVLAVWWLVILMGTLRQSLGKMDAGWGAGWNAERCYRLRGQGQAYPVGPQIDLQAEDSVHTSKAGFSASGTLTHHPWMAGVLGKVRGGCNHWPNGEVRGKARKRAVLKQKRAERKDQIKLPLQNTKTALIAHFVTSCRTHPHFDPQSLQSMYTVYASHVSIP